MHKIRSQLDDKRQLSTTAVFQYLHMSLLDDCGERHSCMHTAAASKSSQLATATRYGYMAHIAVLLGKRRLASNCQQQRLKSAQAQNSAMNP